MRYAILVFIALVVVSAGAVGREPPSSPEARPIDVANLRLTHPRLKLLFEQFRIVARRRAAPEWRNTSWHEPKPGSLFTRYEAEWNSRAPLRDDRNAYVRGNHTIRISAFPHAVAEMAKGVRRPLTHVRHIVVFAVRIPVEGWGARVEFTTDGPPETDRVEVTLFRCELGDDDPEPWSGRRPTLRFPYVRCGGDAVFEGLRYGWGAALKPEASSGDLVRSLLYSAESFRDTALAEYDRMEREVRERFADGKLIDDLVVPAGWSARDGAPPPVPEDETRLTDEQRSEILGRALSQIDWHRDQVRKHYRDLHTAATEAFPLLDCLGAVDRRTPGSE